MPLTEGIFPCPPTLAQTQVAAQFFLDARAFPQSNVLDSGMAIPKPILEMLESKDEGDCIRDQYVDRIHSWLPMIDMARLNQQAPDFHLKPDVGLALLFSCMRLICYPLVYDLSRTPLYYTVKQFFHVVQDSGLMSIRFLQAAVLIALYEVAHGAYPVGYLSVCHAARLGMMMSLHDRAGPAQKPLDGPSSETWRQSEEERRTWWAVLLLDR